MFRTTKKNSEKEEEGFLHFVLLIIGKTWEIIAKNKISTSRFFVLFYDSWLDLILL